MKTGGSAERWRKDELLRRAQIRKRVEGKAPREEVESVCGGEETGQAERPGSQD